MKVFTEYSQNHHTKQMRRVGRPLLHFLIKLKIHNVVQICVVCDKSFLQTLILIEKTAEVRQTSNLHIRIN